MLVKMSASLIPPLQIGDFFRFLAKASTSDYLIVGGLIFLFISIAGNISDKLEPGKTGRIVGGLVGSILLISGVLLAGPLLLDGTSPPDGTPTSDGTSPPDGTQTPDGEHSITIRESNGSWVNYTVEVEQGLQPYGDQIERNDTINKNIAKGGVQDGSDRYKYHGKLIRFAADGDVVVFIDGEKVDPTKRVQKHTITIQGNGDHAEYSFRVGHGLNKTQDLYCGIHESDSITSGTEVKGEVVGGCDSYEYHGELIRFDADPGVKVFIDGERREDPTESAENN